MNLFPRGPLGFFHPVLVAPTEEGHGTVGASPEEVMKLIRGLEHLPYGKAAAVQLGEEKGVETSEHLPVSEGDTGKLEWDFSSETIGKARKNGFKLKREV
ncbi:hypothetical protein HGM15179_015784 [Zosterops borbonicus]|uniref:Uncharacterized protein n=1 Tax=Zosterops borbonicus TaxID=364589 RepID=A0A8K1G461_9PASS|nr:hypothetical protein HGM15179_015784 [Zosterops borbonicus]